MAQKQMAPTTQIIRIPIKSEIIAIPLKSRPSPLRPGSSLAHRVLAPSLANVLSS
jgi:hypothetical protein